MTNGWSWVASWPRPYGRGAGVEDLLFTRMDKLHINNSRLGDLGLAREQVRCNFSYIGAKPAKPWTPDYPAIPLEGDMMTLSPKYNAIATRCSKHENVTASLDLSHIVLFYVPPPDLTERLYIKTGNTTGKWVAGTGQKTGQQYSVATVVIDSLSQMNMYRSLPRSVQKAKAMGGIAFSGFHKVGLNSKPNMMAMASGSSSSSGKTMQPLVQGLYHNLGWKTVYFEDMLHWVGHALRSEAMSPYPWDLTYHEAWKYLRGSHNHQSQLLAIWDLLLAYKDVPSYIHSHLSEYIHDNLNMGKNYDADLVAMLTDLSARAALDDTFFLLMGDHGYRQGSFAATKQGVIENNMPALIIIPPANFAKDHPDLYANLKANAELLTSMFDIHHMLRQVVKSFVPHPCHLLRRSSPWPVTRRRWRASTHCWILPAPPSSPPSPPGAAPRRACPWTTAAAPRAMSPSSPPSWRAWPGPPSKT